MYYLRKLIRLQSFRLHHRKDFHLTALRARESDYSPDEIFSAGVKDAKEYEKLVSKGGTSSTTISKLTRDYDLSFKGIKRALKRRRLKLMAEAQDPLYALERIERLGFEMHAARLIYDEGGGVKFSSLDEWFMANRDGVNELPSDPNKRLRIEELNLSWAELIYEGYLNFKNLNGVKKVILSQNEFLDDFCLDRVCGLLHQTLLHLDISHCKQLTSYGLESIVKLKNLQTLNVEGLDHVANLHLICLLLLDINPKLKIIGINLDKKIEEVEEEEALVDKPDDKHVAQAS